MWLKRLRMPVVLASMALIGAFGGLALAQDPQSADQIEAVAEQIDCSTLEMTAAQDRQVKDCWSTALTEPAPAGATEMDIALAKQAALCDAVEAVEARPEFCSISDQPSDGETTGP